MKILEGQVDLDRKRLTRMPKNPDGTWLFDGVVIKGYFSLDYNKLTSLEGCPEEVHGHFFCDDNLLETLDGCPKVVTGDFWCMNNSKRFDRDYIRSKCQIGGNIHR